MVIESVEPNYFNADLIEDQCILFIFQYLFVNESV